jgi:hypothetical protein
MKTEKIKISKIKKNPNNPRLIKDNKFHKLVKSIKEFPEMLDIRPIVVNEEMIVLGGNMRLKACQEAGLKEIPVIKASELSENQQREFIVKDNVGFGEWDWDMVANEWDNLELNEWGLDVWDTNSENVNYVNNGDENSEWVGMPEFEKGEGYIQCNIIFSSEEERDNYIKNNLEKYKIINRNKQKIVYFGTEKK